MLHPTKTRAFIVGSVLLALASVGYTRPARAESTYPAALQKALNARFPGKSFCVPACTACHTVTTGGPGNYNVFGLKLLGAGLFQNDALVAPALNKVLDMKLDSDGDGINDEDELKAFSSPSVAGPPGDGAFCPDLAYGCGARIASAPPPVDQVGLFSAGLVVLGLTVLRRRRRVALSVRHAG